MFGEAMRLPRVLLALVAVATAGTSVFLDAQTTPLGDFDGHGDVGAPKVAGSAANNPVSQPIASYFRPRLNDRDRERCGRELIANALCSLILLRRGVWLEILEPFRA
jgi:hypothetical protein